MSLRESSSMPHLPGFRRSTADAKMKASGFHFVNGYPLEKSPLKKAASEKLRNSKSSTSLPTSADLPDLKRVPGSKMVEPPSWLAKDRQVLKFHAYFKEAVHENSIENHRVRKCDIYLYLNDGTIHVSEPKIENSGIPQGIFIKRHKIPKGDTGLFYGIHDFLVGSDIILYGRHMHIVSCNDSTAAYYSKIGIDQTAKEEFPDDIYKVARDARMRLEKGEDTTVYRGVLMNPSKAWMEASLGKHMRDSEQLSKYIKNDRKVLRFECAWDDRDKLYGTILKYTLHYFLADDTLEIMEHLTKNSGRDSFPRLLKRSALPKDFLDKEAGSLSWKDLSIGGTFQVFGRTMIVLNCDSFTREYYAANGIELGEAASLELPKREFPKALPPPSTGFGSEEDSMGSCISLMPKPPRKDMKKLMAMDHKVLRFSAAFVDARPEDAGRQFLISYYLADETLSVSEQPRRNSGIVGGKFLRRGKYMNEGAKPIVHTDFAVGNQIKILSHTFKILDADLYTIKYMSGHPDALPFSNVAAVIKKLTLKLRKENKAMGKTFRLVDKNHSGFISISELKELLDQYFSSDEISFQELLTIMRFFDQDEQGLIEVNEFSRIVFETDVVRTSDEIGGGFGEDIVIPVVPESYAETVRLADIKDTAQHLEARILFEFANHCKNRGIGLQQVFMIFDHDRSGTLEGEEFKAMLYSNEFIPGDMDATAVNTIHKFFFGDKDVVDMKEFRSRLIKVFKDYEFKEMSRILHRGSGDVGF